MERVKVSLLDKENSFEEVWVQYHSGNEFSVFKIDENNNKEVVLQNVQVLINPEKSDELIFRTQADQSKLHFLEHDDSAHLVNFYDHDGMQLPF